MEDENRNELLASRKTHAAIANHFLELVETVEEKTVKIEILMKTGTVNNADVSTLDHAIMNILPHTNKECYAAIGLLERRIRAIDAELDR